MSIHLYMDYMSQPSRAVWAFCLLNKIPHTIHEVRIAKLEMKSPEFKKINPMGKVPAIVDADTGLQLAQSHAIIRYLANKYPQSVGDWYPAHDHTRKAVIDEYLDFHHTNTRKCSFLVFNSVFCKKMGIPTDPQYIEAEAKKNVDRALKAIESHYLKGRDYLAGDKPTVADLSGFFEVLFLLIAGENFEKYPKVKAWLKRVGQIAEVKEANKVFDKFIAKTQPNAKL